MTALRPAATSSGDRARVNTFPSRLPLSQLDHVYARGLKPRRAWRCRAAASGGACRTTCRWSPSSTSPRRASAMARPRSPRPAASRRMRLGTLLLKGSARAVPGAGRRRSTPRRAEVLAGDLHLRLHRRAAAGRRGAGARGRAAACGVRVVVDGFGTGDVAGRVAGALEDGRRALARLHAGARLGVLLPRQLAPPAPQAVRGRRPRRLLRRHQPPRRLPRPEPRRAGRRRASTSRCGSPARWSPTRTRP